MTFNNVAVGDMTQIYYTYLRKSAPSRRFSMTEPETDSVQGPGGDEPGALQENFAMYIPNSPKTVGEARRRMGEIFIRVGKIKKPLKERRRKNGKG